MSKMLQISIQIDDISTDKLAEIEKKIEEILKDYPRNRVSFNLRDRLGAQIPQRQ
jgi:hypothetical protein